MRRSFLRQVLVVLATCALFLPIALNYGVTAEAGTASFSFTDNSCTSFSITDNGGGNFTLNCVTAGPQPFTCSIGLSNNSPILTTLETLTANCSGGTPPVTTYQWSASANPAGCPPLPNTTSQQTLALAAPTTQSAVSCSYNVTATDSANNQFTPAQPKTVNYTTGGGGGGGGGGGPFTCNNVTGPTVNITIPWPTDGAVHQYQTGPVAPNGAVVVQFTTSGVANSSAGQAGVISAVEYGGPPSGRTGSLSTQPCDLLGANALPLKGGGKSKFASNASPSISFTQGSTTVLYAADLQPGTPYYLNLSNTNNTCGAGISSCPMLINFQAPGGT